MLEGGCGQDYIVTRWAFRLARLGPVLARPLVAMKYDAIATHRQASFKPSLQRFQTYSQNFKSKSISG